MNLTTNDLRLESRDKQVDENESKENAILCRKWFANQLQNNSREQKLCAQSRDVCNFGATLVRRHKITRIPNECLDCDSTADHVFGGRKLISVVDSAEILFLIGCDLESSDSRLKTNLIRLSNALSREFSSRGVRARFQSMKLSSRDRQYSYFWPKFESRLNLNRIKMTENTSHSLDFLLVSSYPSTPSSRHVLMITCEQNCTLDHVDFITARSLLLNSNVFVHVITNQMFRIRAKKARHVIGIDAELAFTSFGSPSRELRDHVMVSRDMCHVLSLETNGTVFRSKALNQKNSRAILAKRIMDNHIRDTCLKCDCVLSRDRMSSNQECVRCQERGATLRNHNNELMHENQEWDSLEEEIEDEDHN